MNKRIIGETDGKPITSDTYQIYKNIDKIIKLNPCTI